MAEVETLSRMKSFTDGFQAIVLKVEASILKLSAATLNVVVDGYSDFWVGIKGFEIGKNSFASMLVVCICFLSVYSRLSDCAELKGFAMAAASSM